MFFLNASKWMNKYRIDGSVGMFVCVCVLQILKLMQSSTHLCLPAPYSSHHYMYACRERESESAPANSHKYTQSFTAYRKHSRDITRPVLCMYLSPPSLVFSFTSPHVLMSEAFYILYASIGLKGDCICFFVFWIYIWNI